MLDERKLAALRELLDPEVVAAWLDEVDGYRSKVPVVTPVQRPAPAVQPVDTRILTVPEVAERLGVGKHTVYELVKRDEIPHVKVGTRIRFGSQVINDWIANGGTASEGQ